MLQINFSNAEELVFEDRELQRLLPPDFFSIFEQWRLGRQMPMLRNIGKQAILDFLNTVEEEHIRILEKYFQDKVVVEKLDYSLVKNIKIPLDDPEKVCEKLCGINGNFYYSTWRDSTNLYISLWR